MLKPLNEILIDKPIVNPSNLIDSKLPISLQSKLAAVLDSQVYDLSSFTSYAVTDKEKDGKPANYAIIPNQYFRYVSEMYLFATELYKYFEIFEKVRPFASSLVGSSEEIKSSIRNNDDISNFFESESDIDLFSKFLDKADDTYRLGSKRLINDQGKPRGSRDCFGSVVLKEINLPDTSSGIFGRLAFDLCGSEAVYQDLVKHYSSIKTENTSSVEIVKETSIRDFAFNVISYLYKNYGEDLLVDITSSATDNKKSLPYLPHIFLSSDTLLDRQKLCAGEAQTLRFFESAINVSSGFLYLSNQWNGDDRVGLSFGSLKKYLADKFQHLSVAKKGEAFCLYLDSSKYEATPLSKPFILLAGISGTGKTRFIREQAKLTGSISETYCLTSVRPDWHEPSDLLGYVSRLSGRAEYVVTDVLKFIVKAWIELKQAGLTLQGSEVTGEQNQQQQVKPFWLCLDEMNLAPVEQYFADYLSVLETRQWSWDGDNFNYQCDPLLKQNLLENIDNKDKLKIDLGLDGCDDLWQHFLENGIGIPFNLIVAGTVNMDETTHGFSRKVIDRALTFDFGEFFPNDFNAFFEPNSEPKALSYPVFTDGRNKAELSDTHDTDGALSIDFLTQINAILHNTPFKLAYRALNELLLTVMIQKPEDVIGLQAVWDDFLMCKVLPRIEGDIDKLSKGDSEQNILEQLSGLLNLLLAEIWDTQVRPDLFQKSAKDGSVLTIECRSKAKLEWMNSQLKNGFTSFWP